MIKPAITSIVSFCRVHAALVVLAMAAATAGMGWYVATHFSISTDVDRLLSEDLDWRRQEAELEKAFPHKTDMLVVVVDGETPDAAEDAAARLAEKMAAASDSFRDVRRPESADFFRKNGLLFLSEEKLGAMLEALVQSQPLIGSLAADMSLRGLAGTFGLMMEGLRRGEADYAAIAKPLELMAAAVESVENGNDRILPWRMMMSAEAPQPRDLRKFILTRPVLDYGELSPGHAASKHARAMAAELGLTPERGVRVRLTGKVALNDEEFASVADGTGWATAASGIMVLFILFMALRSARLIIPILLTLICGLAATTAFAMLAVGSLNLISVAFAVMFVGIAVDFGIQFGVRYRDQRHREPDEKKAMLATAGIVAIPLAMAAMSTAVGFLAFTPTDYRGVAELGLIAGAGMVIAFVLNITLLPALLTLFKPLPEPESVGFAWAAPADKFLARHRKPVLTMAVVVGLAALLPASQLRFDFDPLNLKDAKTESVSTLFDLMRDPDASPYTIEILRPSLDEAAALAAKLSELGEVKRAMTLRSFVPEDQDKKLALIADAAFLLLPTLSPVGNAAAATDADNIAALREMARELRAMGDDRAEARRLAAALDTALAKAEGERGGDVLRRLDFVLLSGMRSLLPTLREALAAEKASESDITADLARDWIASDGRAKIEVYPKGDARDHAVLTAFTDAVRKVAPDAGGAPVSIQESGRTVTSAFFNAGILAILAIGALGWLALRNIWDVAFMLLPLLLAGTLTLATMVIIDLPLNFANIISLPLLLSLGVSYSVYFVAYRRAGMRSPLQSSMARAVLFSAATTLVAFGSLSFSPHPGTSGMGELLTIALLYSLSCVFLVFPALPEKRLSA